MQTFEQKLFESIKLDNLVVFSRLIKESSKAIKSSFGRFPILTICYLYNSKNIIRFYEKELIKITDFNRLYEPFDLYKKFRLVAGKNLKFYIDENSIIYPLDMLAILHKDKKVKVLFNGGDLKIQQQNNILSIYNNIFLQKAIVVNNKIKISKKSLDYYEQKYLQKFIAISISFCLFFVGLFFALNFTVGMGALGKMQSIYSYTQLCSGKMWGKYKLGNDIEIQNFDTLSNFNGVLDGNSKTLILNSFNNKSLFNKFSGTIKNLNIICNTSSEIVLNASYNLLCAENNGTIDNVNITFIASENILMQKQEDKVLNFTLLADKNNGTIKNCSITYSLNLVGSGEKGDGYFSAIASENNGKIENCEVLKTSVVTTEDVDICGLVITNNENASIVSCKNYASLNQNNVLQGWYPNICGISNVNYGFIETTYNFGNLMVTSTDNSEDGGLVLVGGICITNYNIIRSCLSKSEINVSSIKKSVISGGITCYCGVNETMYSIIRQCGAQTNFNINVEDVNKKSYIGGICGEILGEISNNYILCDYSNAIKTNNYVGNLAGKANVTIDFMTTEDYLKACQNMNLREVNGNVCFCETSNYDFGFTNLTSYSFFSYITVERTNLYVHDNCLTKYSSKELVENWEGYFNAE